jgi:hypothetical protein
MNNLITNVGLDFGNGRIKIAILWNGEILFASIPSIYAFDEPVNIKSGKEGKVDTFYLLFAIKPSKDPETWYVIKLWFGDDILSSENTIQKIDAQKYTKSHIQYMLQAVLYQWSLKHEISLKELGKLNICVSMPPGSYQKATERKKAEKVYRSAFNTGQSHIQLRDGKESVQIVTQFHSLQREAVVWGKDIPRKNELVLVFDFGRGTDDVVLFNGGVEPTRSRTYKTGLLHTYHKVNPINPMLVELEILRDKNYLPAALASYFNQKEVMIGRVLNSLPDTMSKRAYLIGGGAEMIKRQKAIKSTFMSLLPTKKLIIKDQYATAEANLREASK